MSVRMKKKNVRGASGESFAVNPIGVVRSGAAPGTYFHLPVVDVDDIVAEIEIFPEFKDGLLGIENYRRLLVLFWFNMREGDKLQVHPRGDETRPIRGVFSTRSQYRPNPVGATVVELLERRDNVLIVRGLDAWEGSPVLDIKEWFEKNR